MSQRERDVLKVMASVLKGDRTQAEAARLLGRSVRQVRRIQRKLESQGDKAVVHKLRGRRSNRRLDEAVRASALRLYREKYGGFGPTMAAEKLAEADGVTVAVRTLREWLLAEGLWDRRRRRERHRSRRERKGCFGEMVQADASEHDWLEGRGPRMVLVGIIDDASSRMMARFYEAETTEAYMGLLGRWLRKHGRPVGWYCDRDSVFRAEDAHGEPVATQFSRALSELGIQLTLANSPQAKGRIERAWGTAQERLVNELRLAKAATMAEANEVLEKTYLPWFNRCCTVKPASDNDAHRPLGKGQDLAVILSIQSERKVANDYTIRFENRVHQLLPPAWPGQRGGVVTIEQRLDGSMHVRFKDRYLEHKLLTTGGDDDGGGRRDLGALPPDPRSLAPGPIPAEGAEVLSKASKAKAATPATTPTPAKAKGPATVAAGPSAVHRAAGCSGRTPALPCPSGGGSCGSGKDAWRPGKNHKWREPFLRGSPRQADISNGRK